MDFVPSQLSGKEEGCRAASWRKIRFSRSFSLLASANWLGLQDHLVGILDWILVRCWMFMLTFLETVFRRPLPFWLRKKTRTENLQINLAKKPGGENLFFVAFLALFFVFLWPPFSSSNFYLQIEKIRAESVLRENSLKRRAFQGITSDIRKICRFFLFSRVMFRGQRAYLGLILMFVLVFKLSCSCRCR